MERPSGSRSPAAHERTDGKKRKQNADRRGSTCLPCGKRAPCRARSPVGVPRRFCPWDSRIPRCGVGPGFAELAPRWRGSPAGANPGYSETPRTPVIVPADMMSDTAGVQWGRTLCARAPHPAPASRSHRLTSLHEEREAGAFSRRAGKVKPNHRRALLFDSTLLFVVMLLLMRTPWEACKSKNHDSRAPLPNCHEPMFALSLEAAAGTRSAR